MDKITENSVYQALNYMGETDETYARSRANMEWLKHQSKVVYSMAAMESSETTVKGRECDAETSKAYQEAMRKWTDSIYDYHLIASKRKRAETTIDLFRTLSATRRTGVVL